MHARGRSRATCSAVGDGQGFGGLGRKALGKAPAPYQILPTAKSTDKKAKQSTFLARVGTWFTQLMPTAEQERSKDSDGDHSLGSNQREQVMSFMKKKTHTHRKAVRTY